MAYKIQYTPQENSRYPIFIKQHKVKWGKICMVILLFAAVLWMSGNGIPDFLIPGDPKVTKTAAETMVMSMKSGESMDTAILTFCRQIIDGSIK